MKRIAITMLIFVFVAGFAFAEEASGPSDQMDLSFSAEVSSTFGVDLDNGTTGFKNDASANLEVIFGSEAAKENSGEGVYGYVKVEDVKFSNGDGDPLGTINNTAGDYGVDTDADYSDDSYYANGNELLVFGHGDIVGQIMMNGAYITLWDGGKPSAKTDEASSIYSSRVDVFNSGKRYGVNVLKPTDGSEWPLWDLRGGLASSPWAESGGMQIGYAQDGLFDLGLNVTSAYAWDNANTHAEENQITLWSIDFNNDGDKVDTSITGIDEAVYGIDFNGDGDKIDTGLSVDETVKIPASGLDGNAYNMEVYGEFTGVENLTLAGSANFTFGYEDSDTDTDRAAALNTMGFGMNAEYEYALDDTFSIVPVVGADIVMPGDFKLIDTDLDGATYDELTFNTGYVDAEMGYQFAGGLRLKWPGTYDDDADNAIFAERTVFSGITVGADYSKSTTKDAKGDMNLSVSSWEDTEGGLIPGLGMALAFEMANLLEEAGETFYGFQGYVDYQVGMAKPYIGVNYIDYGETSDNQDMFLKAGLELTSIIPNTDLTFAWDSNEMIDGFGPNEDKMGAFTTEVTLNF